jgi:hypothetical protein
MYGGFIAEIEQKLVALDNIPGQFSYVLASELFYEYSTAWPEMIEEFVTNVLKATEECMEAAVEANVKRDVQAGVYQALVGPVLRKLRDGLSSFPQKNAADHRSLETINFGNTITNHISIARTAETGKVCYGDVF